MLDQRGATALECLEIDRCIRRRTLLPTPLENPDPCACQGADSGLMRVAFVPLLLRVALSPEGMPHRRCGPLHARLPEALWPLETPVPPGFLAAAVGPWRDAGICLQCGGGRLPLALLPEGDQEAGSKAGTCPGEPHASIASGVCVSWQHARCAVPAAWRPISCWVSAQSMPTKAAKVSGDVCVMRHLPEWVSVARRDRHADVLRRHERGAGSAADPACSLANASAPAAAKRWS
jgi:hypothetical protein